MSTDERIEQLVGRVVEDGSCGWAVAEELKALFADERKATSPQAMAEQLRRFAADVPGATRRGRLREIADELEGLCP